MLLMALFLGKLYGMRSKKMEKVREDLPEPDFDIDEIMK